jgi:hypothetical protein
MQQNVKASSQKDASPSTHSWWVSGVQPTLQFAQERMPMSAS